MNNSMDEMIINFSSEMFFAKFFKSSKGIFSMNVSVSEIIITYPANDPRLIDSKAETKKVDKKTNRTRSFSFFGNKFIKFFKLSIHKVHYFKLRLKFALFTIYFFRYKVKN